MHKFVPSSFLSGKRPHHKIQVMKHSSALFTPDSVADAHKAEDFGASLCKQDEAIVEIFQSGWFGILCGGKP
jgi:hypothetical protein